MVINIRMLKMVQKAECGQKGKRKTHTNFTCLAVDRWKDTDGYTLVQQRGCMSQDTIRQLIK